MSSYVCYRLPEQLVYTRLVQHRGHPDELATIEQLSGRHGFVLAPFAPDAHFPVLLLRPDTEEQLPIPEASEVSANDSVSVSCAEDRASYASDFHTFHEQLCAGTFRKLVLARSMLVERPSQTSAEALFLRACQLYPHLMVALVSTPVSGTWLMATPEVLLRGDGHRWHTMALAGTMKFDETLLTNESREVEWSDKDLREQHLVASYLEDLLQQYAEDITEKGPVTSRAADLVHLRSDFSFRLHPHVSIGLLLQALHPTPAVCGLPKNEARSFILANEHTQRGYYSGFCGPLAWHGDTRLYVSLRCMQVLPETCRLFAGGGLLADSLEATEWQETKNKLNTMLHVLR